MGKKMAVSCKMGFVPVATIVGLLLAFGSAAQAQVKHFGDSDVTGFESCTDITLRLPKTPDGSC